MTDLQSLMDAQKPAEQPVVVTRGDTDPIRFTIKQSDGSARDITGWTAKLTVSTNELPTDQVDEVFQLAGTVTDGPGGKLAFPHTGGSEDTSPQLYYFDVERDDGTGNTKTIIKSTYLVLQDITKD